MIVLRIIGIAIALSVLTVSDYAQYQETGTVDYVLGNSSVMWIPRSSSIFLNPGELARLHQNEFLVSTGRFRTLVSMNGAVFVPNTGTFGLSIAPDSSLTSYSFGFGRIIGNYNTVGAAFSATPNVEGGFRFSFGGSLHLPTDGQESGLHAGLSLTDIPAEVVVKVGAAYWMIPNALRLQLATQTRSQRAEFLGAEVKVTKGLRLQVGMRGFNKILGGASYAMSYATLAFGAGPEGVSFTMNVRVGDAASDSHDEAYSEGDEAFLDRRYGDAKESFLKAVQYDEYDQASRLRAEKSQQMMDSSVAILLQQARENEEQQNYAEAMRAYAQILKIDPQQSTAFSNLADVEARLKHYVLQLLIAGDSLKNRHDIVRARHSYELALELDPDNDSVSVRMDELESLSKENVRSMLSRARSFLRKNLLDEAQKEYERIISVEPENGQARSGLRSVVTRRINEQVARGNAAYDSKDYLGALQIFMDVVRKDENNKEARQLLEKSRNALKSDVDRLFKTGLQFYIKEDFKSAIAAWDKVLLIQPSDSSTIEYRKRAEEKLKALEQYK